MTEEPVKANGQSSRSPTTAWTTIRLNAGRTVETEDEIAAEFPLTIRLDGEEFATLVCSPDDLADLVVGFLASEGVIRGIADIRSWSLDEDRGFAYVELVRPQSTAKDLHSKRIIGSCCGKSRQFYFQNDARTARTISGGTTIPAERCFELMRRLQLNSDSFRLTGGVHNAALFDEAGGMVARADIGRHNALDKLFGHCLRNRLSAQDRVLAFSGRLSSEVVLKAAKIGCPIVLSKSAPTDLALRLAEDLGLTCVGFIRSDSMNLYTHPARILGL
ncbi:formate dehydrogenase family accessory protein FdhD [Cohnella sp. CIP 111063]|uniref:formate dehydrogenase accessory sulfurtransferase FdhD n=1 Tax=unclassified Cohnella TaxID=2636738 RepID=UPI000B8C30D5|nr:MULTISPECIES: formate dehydrogenase accessory sulfurtransferase FdhD [unclassified Cohnella]OXS55264.1 formate dehydrogenase family accessory protein FdhD [Cohnella sp. CIP 111063]PRX65689.1 FdhD protein [Cohnella sp. SGD-V74]